MDNNISNVQIKMQCEENDKFKMIKKQFIEMMIDIKDFNDIKQQNKLFIDLILKYIENFDDKIFFETIKKATEYFKEDIDEKNVKDVIINFVNELEKFNIKNEFKFLNNLKQDEMLILIKHIRILISYILKIKNEK